MAQPGTQRVIAISAALSQLLSGSALRRIQFKVGMDTKKATLDGAATTLGSDRAMRNFKGGRVRLGAGWDPNNQGIVLKLRPVGLWVLAEEGRKKEGNIYPRRGRRGRGRRAVWMGKGYAAYSHYGRSQGKKSITVATRKVDQVAGKSLDKAIQGELARIIH